MSVVTPNIARNPARHHETADEYQRIVVCLCTRYRVVTCKDHLQWILQRRDGERHGRARWAGVGYFLTREALLRASRALCARVDPAALAALAGFATEIPTIHLKRTHTTRKSPFNGGAS